MGENDIKRNIENAIKSFGEGNLSQNSLSLFESLGYNCTRRSPLHNHNYDDFRENFININSNFDAVRALTNEWIYVDLLFQLSKDEILTQTSLFDTKQVNNTIIETYLFFSIELKEKGYSRSALSDITREVNKLFPMPVMILFKYGNHLTFSVINRRLHKKDKERDVLEKVTQVKDISIQKPHRAHVEILYDLSFEHLREQFGFSNFVELHNAWRKIFDISELNRKFYEELFKWYLLAVKNVKFPQLRPEQDKIPEKAHQSESVIRLLTRLLFCWFIKEKEELIPAYLFKEKRVKELLIGFSIENKSSSIYYQAILQNLFFATLSVPIADRLTEGAKGLNIKNPEFDGPVFRFTNNFKNGFKDIEIFKNIPFLNGGLFECLDEVPSKSNGIKTEVRLDGFTDIKNKQAVVPDFLFWGEYRGIDLSEEFDNVKRKNETVCGIIDLLDSYKFTIEENTPLDEEIALDPDLLGRTFENLLATYNPETQSNARKQTGSFYTPRDVVNFMVDESLINYLNQNLNDNGINNVDKKELIDLLSYTDLNPFLERNENTLIIKALENLKVLDPACGSGAFPMGVLHKLVWILRKVDPENKAWFESLLRRFPDYVREEMRLRLKGENWNYLRKLGIIQQSIYGVDIQPIAIQIAKLRFFISLIVDQKIKDTPENNFGLLPLPNLDFKLVCANTLIAAPDENIKSDGKLQLTVADPFFDNFKELTSKYFSEYHPAEKEKLKVKIEDLIENKSNSKIKEAQRLSKHTDERFSKHIAEKNKSVIDHKNHYSGLWKSYCNLFKHESVGFFDTKYFFPEINNDFHIVIGNPPYGAKFTEIEKKYFKASYDYQDYQAESFLLFIEKSLQLVKKNGIIAFIIPNTWLTNVKLLKIRRYLTGENTIINISHYHKAVFNAVVDTEVVILKKGYNQNNKVEVDNHIDIDDVIKLVHDQVKWKELNGNVINIFSTDKIERIISKITADSVVLSEYCNVVTGMKPYQVGKGIPKQDRETVTNRVFDAESKIDDTYKPLLRGRDIDKYETKWDGKRWIKYGDWLAEPRESANFQAKEKIVIRQTGDSLIATLDDRQFICMNNLHVITLKKTNTSLKFILALLNSNLLNFYYQYLNPEKGEALAEVKKDNVEKLVIKGIENQDLFEHIVNYILFLKAQSNSLSSFFQRLIENMVYEEYLPEQIKNANCEVIKYLTDLPKLTGQILEDTKTIDRLYLKLSDPKNPISSSMLKLLNVEDLIVIENSI